MENLSISKLGFFTKLKLCLFSPKSYIKFLKDTTGSAILYIFLLSLIFGFFASAKYAYNFKQLFISATSSIKTNIKDLHFSNSKLSVAQTEPIIIKNTDKNEETVFIIDTLGKTNESSLSNYQSYVFVSDSNLVFKNERQSKTINFSEFKNLDFDEDSFLEFLNVIQVSTIIIILCLGTLLIFIKQFFSALFVALFSLIIAKLLKVNLKFIELYKLSFYALTSVIILNCFFSVFSIPRIGFLTQIIYLGITLTYMYYALIEIKHSEKL